MSKNLDYLIVTNNPCVNKEYENKVIFIEGSFEDVLFKVRDLSHMGYEIINHPLGASIRMFFSPYRSIAVRKNDSMENQFYIEIIENSILNYQKQMKDRNIDIINSDDYSMIDIELLKSTLREFERVYN